MDDSPESIAFRRFGIGDNLALRAQGEVAQRVKTRKGTRQTKPTEVEFRKRIQSSQHGQKPDKDGLATLWINGSG